MIPVRCKFVCTEHSEFLGWNGKILHKVKFSPVSKGSPENEAFYDATPGGSFDIQTIAEMPFELGKEYYLDITQA